MPHACLLGRRRGAIIALQTRRRTLAFRDAGRARISATFLLRVI